MPLLTAAKSGSRLPPARLVALRREAPELAPKPGEREVRCGRCRTFIYAIEAAVGVTRVRSYCKRCGNIWVMNVPPPVVDVPKAGP